MVGGKKNGWGKEKKKKKNLNGKRIPQVQDKRVSPSAKKEGLEDESPQWLKVKGTQKKNGVCVFLGGENTL